MRNHVLCIPDNKLTSVFMIHILFDFRGSRTNFGDFEIFL